MRWIVLAASVFAATFLAAPRAQAQPFQAAELEGLLAPVALHPDAVLWNVLDAATEPAQVAQAAAWSRAHPGLTGDAAVAAVQDEPWHPAVKALVAYPDLLARMAESPQWTFDLGNAYLSQREEVLAAVQTLRQRAHASGHLQSDETQLIQDYGGVIAVAPAVPHYYVVKYYDPLVVYGPAWRPLRPVYWRPWAQRPVFVNHVTVVKPHHHHGHGHAHWHGHGHKHPRHVHAARPAHKPIHVSPPRNGAPSPAARMQREMAAQYFRNHNIQPTHAVRHAAAHPRAVVQERPRPIVQSHSHARPIVQSHSAVRSGSRPQATVRSGNPRFR